MSREDKKNLNDKIDKHDISTEKKNKKANKNMITDDGNYKDDQKNKKNKKANKILKIILSILLVILIVLGIVFGNYMYKSGGNIKGAIINMVKDVMGDQDPIFVLIMGVSEDISSELTDTIMLAGYNPDTNKAFILSIPRDTFVGTNQTNAGGYDKINALYQKGPERTMEAVENLTGINIDHYITVKTSALVEIVNTIGGVEFDVPINMDYDDTSQDLHIHLKAGRQVLNGDQAEQLVRFRHNNNGTTYSTSYGDNDEGRMRTQREFLKVLAQQVISWNNVDKIKELTAAVFSNLETDMDLSKLLNYIPYAIEFNMENLIMDQLPGTPKKMNELWFYEAEKDEISTLIDQYLDQLGFTDYERQQITKVMKENTNIKNTTSNKKNTTTKNVTSNKKNAVNNTKINKTNIINDTNKINEINTINEINDINITNDTNTTENTTINTNTNKSENEIVNNTNPTNSIVKNEMTNTLNNNTQNKNVINGTNYVGNSDKKIENNIKNDISANESTKGIENID